MAYPDNNDFGHTHFPPIDDSANEEISKEELYPQNMQDEVNEAYNHDKVLPRKKGIDYTADKGDSLSGTTNPNQEKEYK